MNDALTLDRRRVRDSFERAAATYDAAAVLQQEVGERMLSRLDLVRRKPSTLLDAGSGTGGALPALAARYPQARLVAFDLALGMLHRARGRAPWWRNMVGRGPRAVCGDLERLPFAAGSFDLVWSNLALQWVNDLPRAFAEMYRVLAPGGLVMFTTFGPDTLKELRSAYAAADRHTHVNGFVDLHDIGDMLVSQRYADPVMDMEHITLTYADVRGLMHDLKAIGAHNATRGRPTGLGARSRLERVVEAYEVFRRDGRLPATFEVIYGHAWKPEPRLGPSGRPVIEIRSA